MERTTGEYLRRNTRFSVLAYLVNQVARFLLIPIIIAYIDLDGFAIVRLGFVFFGYLAIANFGVNMAYLKYTAECHRSADYERLSRLLSTGVTLTFLLGLVLVGAAFWWSDAIAWFLKEDPVYFADVRFVVRVIPVVAMLSLVGGVSRAVLSGLQRLDIVNTCTIAFSLLRVVVVAALLYAGFGLRSVVIVYGVATVGPLLPMVYFVYRLLPQVHIRLFHMSRDALCPLFSLGGRMQVLGVLGLLVSTLDTVVVFKYMPPTLAGAYMVARQLAQRVQSLPMQGFGALIPASADLSARADHAKSRAVFTAASRITAVSTVFFFAFLFVNSDVFLLGYLGAGSYDECAGFMLMAFCVPVFLHTLTGPGSSMLRGAGKPGREIVYQVLGVGLFLGLFASGLTWGTAIDATWLPLLAQPAALGTASLVFIVLANRFFQERATQPLGEVAWPMLAAVAGAWGIRLVCASVFAVADENRIGLIALVGGMGVLYTGLFALAAWFLPGLTYRDKEQLVKFLPIGERIKERLLRDGA